MDQELAKEVSADQITLIVAGVTLAPPHYSEVYREWPLILADAPPPRDR